MTDHRYNKTIYTFILSMLVWSFSFTVSEAALIINEIAWMGDSESANNEWIELYNSGSAVEVDGWVVSDNQGLDIVLAGTIGAGQYAVLERTDDDSALGTAFLIYTGALGNDGRTISLRRPDNSMADQVSGGENWQSIGGDNVTKETAQYTEAGWITAAATPGSINKTIGTVSDTKEDGIEKNNVAKAEKPNDYISLEIPDTDLKLKIIAPKQVLINQTFTLYTEASGISKQHIDSLSYRWNLGDTQMSVGNETDVSYKHPGTYIITLEATYARHVARARHEIVVLPVTLALEIDRSGYILLHNNSKYEIDLSGYRVQGVDSYVFPPLSFIAPNATLVLSDIDLGRQREQMVVLYDAAAVAQASLVPPRLLTPAHQTQYTAAVNTIQKQPIVSLSDVATKPAGIISAIATSAPNVLAVGNTSDTNSAAAVSTSNAEIPFSWPYLALLSLIIVGILALYAYPQKQQVVAEIKPSNFFD